MRGAEGWLVSLKPLTPPALSPAGTVRRAREDELVDLWAEHVTAAPGGDGDYEDFFEQAVKLEAALAGFGPENVWVWVMRPPTDLVPVPGARNAATGEWLPLSLLEELPRYGHQPGRAGHTATTLEQERLADAYPRYASFRRNAGRRTRLAGINTATDDYRDVVLGLAADGVERFFLKFTRAKAGAFTLDLPRHPGRDDVRAAFPDEHGWNLVRLDGDEDALLVQEHVAMSFEYRLFVVGRRPVTGAGCIEEFTPLDWRGDAFDTRVRLDRPNDDVFDVDFDEEPEEPGEVEDRPELVERMVAFGARVAAELAEEVPDLRQYVLDVAIGPDGEPLVVELNGLLNSGLYATDPRLVTTATASQTKGDRQLRTRSPRRNPGRCCSGIGPRRPTRTTSKPSAASTAGCSGGGKTAGNRPSGPAPG